VKTAAALCGLVVTLAACSGSSSPPASFALRVIDVAGPGRVLADARGFALYMYVPDDRGASVCYGACARVWPPLVLGPGQRAPKAGPGVEKELLGTARRTNGDLQVTYDGWPLYLYIGDNRGQATGQALDMGTWYLISPTGAIDRVPVVS